jgi:hypothetical protein
MHEQGNASLSSFNGYIEVHTLIGAEIISTL